MFHPTTILPKFAVGDTVRRDPSWCIPTHPDPVFRGQPVVVMVIDGLAMQVADKHNLFAVSDRWYLMDMFVKEM